MLCCRVPLMAIRKREARAGGLIQSAHADFVILLERLQPPDSIYATEQITKKIIG